MCDESWGRLRKGLVRGRMRRVAMVGIGDVKVGGRVVGLIYAGTADEWWILSWRRALWCGE